jgi:C4-dicarboxylate transporter DctQ subunit
MSADTEPASEERGAVGAVLRFFDALTGMTTGLLLYVACLFMFAMVITRYLFAYSDPSVEIIARYMMIWASFIGVSAAVRSDANIRFTLLEQFLPEKPKRVLRCFACVVGAGIALGMAYSGIVLVEESMMFNEVMPTALRWPIWIFHLSIAVGGALLVLQLVRAAVHALKGTPPISSGGAV